MEDIKNLFSREYTHWRVRAIEETKQFETFKKNIDDLQCMMHTHNFANYASEDLVESMMEELKRIGSVIEKNEVLGRTLKRRLLVQTAKMLDELLNI